ncbi:MAG TPA: type II toxin-antitoxin system CcdA family antitoxin [Acetobacteraceae bacterium]|jgi:antitoxin CcdA
MDKSPVLAARVNPMTSSLFDISARKQTVSLTVNSDLYRRARAVGINASQVAEAALATALREQEEAKLRGEIRQDAEALARYVEEHGDPRLELLKLSGSDSAA